MAQKKRFELLCDFPELIRRGLQFANSRLCGGLLGTRNRALDIHS
jgi:hypothetical protein